ncbi:MAG: hypothetical protein Q8P48_06920 [Deltaproteobacteria bacterium]|nr:hypothetical protein [Deltaproteobacteria bacterium]
MSIEEIGGGVMSRFVLLFALIAILFAGTVNAAESFFVSCDGSPREAILELPAPAKEWGKVGCSQFGHILMAQNGWFWGQDPTPRPALLPADLLNTMKMRKVGNKVYSPFNSEVQHLGEQEGRCYPKWLWQKENMYTVFV